MKWQLKCLYTLTFPMTFQTGSFTTSTNISPEWICNGKYNCVAGLILWNLLKSILEEHGNCRISAPTVKKASPHPFFYHERKRTLWLIPLSSTCHDHNFKLQSFRQTFLHILNQGQHYSRIWFYTRSSSRKRSFQEL